MTGSGVTSPIAFARQLTRVDTDFAERACAAYGGVYIVVSLVWLWAAEGKLPDRSDAVGAAVCLLGTALHK
jgi:small multidrug resistance family-3 protein